MRTTLTLDDDVAVLLRRLQDEQGLSFKEAVNRGLRAGLVALREPARRRKPYRLKTWSGGKPLIDDLSCVGELLEQLEGPAYK